MHLGEVAFIVQEVENTKGPPADEVKTRLVVPELHSLPSDAFPGILFLLQLEDVLVEVELQLLVGKVDAQLLKTVHLKVLGNDGEKGGRACLSFFVHFPCKVYTLKVGNGALVKD